MAREKNSCPPEKSNTNTHFVCKQYSSVTKAAAAILTIEPVPKLQFWNSLHFECIKAELTADMTAISFGNYSHHYTL
jgi:hypothetical protein